MVIVVKKRNFADNMKLKRIILSAAVLLSSVAVDAQSYYKIGEQVSLFNEVCRRLNAMYVDTLNAEQMVTNAIDGMTYYMDPYTQFYSAKDKENLNTMLTGKYAGIGAIIKYCLDKDHVEIDYPFAGSPAMEVGLQMGDVILAIDDTVTIGKDASFVSSHLRGEAGTEVKVKVQKLLTGKTVTKTIIRRAIQRPEITCSFVDNVEGKKVGVIGLSDFTIGCYDKFKNAFLDLQRQGIEKLVIDLRGNGGGSVQECVDMANMFIPHGELVVQTRGKNAQLNKQYKASREPLTTDLPLLVLVDDESASASEIFAGCLQDLDRAKIAGQKTYGKGIVQQTVSLQNDAELKVTVSKYYLPSGRCVQARNYKKGKEENVADSLKHVFYTRSGREVVDGSGIIPDLEVKADTMPRILYYINAGDSLELMHNFVCDYLKKNYDKIGDPLQFSLSDADYTEFKHRVINSNFTYDPYTEKFLAELKKVADAEGYYTKCKDEFEALEKKLKHDLDYDLDYNKKQIRGLLEYQILLGRYGVAEASAHNFRYDKVYNEAVKSF